MNMQLNTIYIKMTIQEECKFKTGSLGELELLFREKLAELEERLEALE